MLSENEQKTDLSEFLKFVKHNFKTLVFFSLLGGILAFTLTFFVPKEYKSYGIVFPPSSTSIDNSIDYPNFGYDVEADRLIQILGSDEIRDSIVRKYKLDDYFEIDKTKSDWRDNLAKKYSKNIKFERTPAMSVMLSARTKDPELSAEIINHVILLGDAFREKIYKKNIITAYESAQQDYLTQKKIVDSMQIALGEKLKQNKLSSLLFLMSDAQISFDMDKLNSVKSSADPTIGGSMIEFKAMYKLLEEYRNRFIKVKKTYANSIPKLYVINYGEPNYKKISPSFTVNTLMGGAFALIATFCILFIRKNITRE